MNALSNLKTLKQDKYLGDIMYSRIEEALEENGELMIRTDSGEEHELHLHNVEFNEKPFVKIHGEDRTHWLNIEKVERYWIHQDF